MVRKGLVESLYDIFGGTKNKKGYITLNPKISTIYGDGLGIERSIEICERLMKKGFASSNWVCGIGSYFYQFCTRDVFGFAMKATYAEALVNSKLITIEVYKDPVTDDGTKKSLRGLIAAHKDNNNKYYAKDRATWEEVLNCEYKPVFRDSKILYETSLSEMRERVNNNL
jgi:nicotinamide phosphoribosyltransferase